MKATTRRRFNDDARIITVHLDTQTRGKIEMLTKVFFTSKAELVRAAIIDWLTNPGVIEDVIPYTAEPGSRNLAIWFTRDVIGHMDSIEENRSALLRAAIKRYIMKLEALNEL
jgi:hypothetical protein